MLFRSAVGFLSQHAVDLYAVWNQLNETFASITKLLAMVTPIATAAYAVYKSASTKQKMQDVLADPEAPKIAQALPVTPQAVAVAKALTSMLLIGFVLALGAHTAQAASKKLPLILQGGAVAPSTAREDSPAAVVAASGAVTIDPMKPSGDFVGDIITHLNKLGDKAVADIDVANALASAIDADTNKPKDEIAAACYPQAKKFVQTLQGTLTADQQQTAGSGAPGIVTLFERKRLLVIFIKKGLPNYLVIGCAPLLGDEEAKVLAGVLGMVGINFLIPGGGLPAIAGALAPLKIL